MPLVEGYEGVRKLGTGAFGVVWLAQQRYPLDRPVAIKMMNRSANISREDFLEEANAAAKLDHPYIVHIYTIEEMPLCIIMEYIDGRSLEEMRLVKGTLEPGFVVRIIRQCLKGLGFAHTRGMLHRDVKPQNVMVREVDGGYGWNAKLVDFGLATPVSDGTASLPLTVAGTPAFMAPEQYQCPDQLCAATDIWAVGVMTFFCLSGRLPFTSTPSTPLRRLICDAGIPAPVLDMSAAEPKYAHVPGTIARALQKDVSQRYPSAKEFLMALKNE